MKKQNIIKIPKGLLTQNRAETAVNISLLLSKKELEQVKTALSSGKRKALAYLDRTKEPYKKISRGVDINNIDLSLDKVEHCKPQSLYPLELLTTEVETLIYCLECSGKSKSKETEQLINSLYASLE